MFEDSFINKNHKRIKKGSAEMAFENYASKILSLNNCDTFIRPPVDFNEVSRLTVFDDEMQQKAVVKTKFSQFNNKRVYFSVGITSLPLSHPYLKELVEYKKKMGQRLKRYFWKEKERFLDIENKPQQLNERINLYREILSSSPQYFLLNQKDNFVDKKTNIFKDTKDIIKISPWM